MTTDQALLAAEKIKEIADAAKTAFVGRDELADAITFSMIAGEHLIVLGPPGTGKSAMIRYFSIAAGLRFYRRLLNPDTPREDLVGPLDPAALGRGEWDRKWAGLALADIAFLDEVGKASDQVQNILLDAMEERRVASGNTDTVIPLHMVMSASNETIDDNPAIWDRFAVRLIVRHLDNAGEFGRLLSDAWDTENPPSLPVTREQLRSARNECKAMAARAGKDPRVQGVLLKLWNEMRTNFPDNRVSDRRWLRTLKVAAGRALAYGRTEIQPIDLDVAKYIIWSDIDNLPDVVDLVDEVLDEERKELSVAQEVVAELETEATWLVDGTAPTDPANISTSGRILFRARGIHRQISDKVQSGAGGEWVELRDKLNAIIIGTER